MRTRPREEDTHACTTQTNRHRVRVMQKGESRQRQTRQQRLPSANQQSRHRAIVKKNCTYFLTIVHPWASGHEVRSGVWPWLSSNTIPSSSVPQEKGDGSKYPRGVPRTSRMIEFLGGERRGFGGINRELITSALALAHDRFALARTPL